MLLHTADQLTMRDIISYFDAQYDKEIKVNDIHVNYTQKPASPKYNKMCELVNQSLWGLNPNASDFRNGDFVHRKLQLWKGMKKLWLNDNVWKGMDNLSK